MERNRKTNDLLLSFFQGDLKNQTKPNKTKTFIKIPKKPGMNTHTYNPSTW
jgi:hypothetical protein